MQASKHATDIKVNLLVAALLILVPALLMAHHGWRWATDEEFDVTGSVVSIDLGEPHGEVTIETDDGDEWLVQVGQPWRNERAGLTAELLSDGTEITIHGHRSEDEDQLVVKAEVVEINEERYVLYPDRE